MDQQDNVGRLSDYHLNDIEKTRSILKGITASAVNPSVSTGIGSAISSVKKKRVVKKPPSDNGGGGNKPPSDGGGNGGSGGNSSSSGGGMEDRLKKMSVFQLIIFGTMVMIIFTFIASKGNSYLMESQLPTLMAKNSLEKDRIVIEQAKIDLERQRREMEAKASEPTTKPIESITTFSCGTDEEKEGGYAKMNIQNIDRNNVSYKASPGCAWVRISVPVHSLTGTKYLSNKDDSSSSTGYTGCATFVIGDRKADSQEFCRSFLDNNQGVLLRLVVLDGGVVFLN